MAKTGSITISHEQNIANNTTEITIIGKIATSGESYRGDHRTGTYTIKKGSTVIKSDSFTSGAPKNSTTTLFKVTFTVNHNDDGSYGTITASYNYDPSGWKMEVSSSKAIPTIPRASVPTLNGTLFTITKKNSNFMRIYTNRKSTSFTHHIYYSVNGCAEIGIISDVADYYDWYFPNTLANNFPNATTVSGYIRLYTFSGNTNIGSKTIPFSMTLADDIVPDITSISCTEAVNDVASLIGAYVQNRSKLELTINGASGIYGSTIKSYKITVADQIINSSSGTTGVITKDGTLTVTATVTDSRGRSVSKTIDIDVLPYSLPNITNLDISRGDTLALLSCSGGCQSLRNGDIEKNAFSYRIELKSKSDYSWTEVVNENTGVLAYAINAEVSGIEPAKSYDFRIYAGDIFGFTNPYELAVSTAFVPFDLDAKNGRIGIRKKLEYENSTIEVPEGSILHVGEKRISMDDISGDGLTWFIKQENGIVYLGTYDEWVSAGKPSMI